MMDGGCRRCTPHFLDATDDIFKDLRRSPCRRRRRRRYRFPFYCFYFSICLIYDHRYYFFLLRHFALARLSGGIR